MRSMVVLCLLVSSTVLVAGCQTDMLFHVPGSGSIQRLHCGDARVLPLSTTNNSHALWSPDGRLVVYRGEDRNGPALFVTDSRGSSPRNITEGTVAVPTHDFVWGPDSAWIFYTASNSLGTLAIYRVNVSAPTVPQPLTPLSLNSMNPSVSPDGREFVYASNHPRDLATFDLYASRVDGDNRHMLVETPGINEYLPSWGPDGRIAFVRDRRVVLRQGGGELVELDNYAGNFPS